MILDDRSIIVDQCTMRRFLVSTCAKQPFSVTISQPVVSGER